MREQLLLLLSQETLSVWDDIIVETDHLYNVDRLWNKGFGDWEVEYKYRRGGTFRDFFWRKDHYEGRQVFSILKDEYENTFS